MITALLAIALPGLFLASTLAPALLLTRKLHWHPLERLCGGIGAALVVLYLLALISFWQQIPWQLSWVYMTLCPLLWIWVMGDLLRSHGMCRAIQAYGVLAIWTFALLVLVRNYAGGTWSFDWVAYYAKTYVLLETPRKLESVRVVVLDRPPGQCLIAAYFLSMLGTRFELFQFIFLLLNTLVVLPCCLIAREMVKGGGRRTMPITALLMLNPLVMQNATYTWTKLLSAFYVITGIALYLTAMRKRDGVRLAWSAGMLAMGCLVHVSAAPYAVFVALHALLTRSVQWRSMLIAGGAAVALLATWFGWVLVVYGPAAAATNPTVPFFRRFTLLENIERIASNIVNTIVPYPLLIRGMRFEQPSRWGQFRDLAFMLYEGNVFAAMGSIGGVVIAILVWRRLARAPASRVRATCLMGAIAMVLGSLLLVAPVRSVAFVALPTLPWALIGAGVAAWLLARICSTWRDPARAPLSRQQKFWRALLIVVPLVGMAAQDRHSEYGLTQIWLQPIVLMGVTLLAAALPLLSWPVRLLIAVGVAIDFAIGILLHFSLQQATTGLSQQAQVNLRDKQTVGLTFLGDHFAAAAPAIQVALVIGAALCVAAIVRGGWRSLGRGRGIG